ncbi:micrococcal nuclease [Mariprofundus micogutta]|uniref:Micrococcal nuclease n=1 Tax=Mariprofundus micogutta TaxID=1921010 RepID=A0A1L8CK05_9PROT|nr:thermonuclease family protein [Mariprofundus micogutta]GAV19230.1 micrococcal nuclease [Mariprofundus micogutta]
MLRSSHKPQLVGLLLCLCLFGNTAHAGTLSIVGHSRWVTVASVFDGDTFRTIAGEKVRLLGINTPEIAHDRQAAQVFGDKAKERLITLIAGKTVQLQFDNIKKDKYGRTLAHVYLRNGAWVNQQLVSEGLAHVYTFMPNHKGTKQLLQSERLARNNMAGIWKSEAFRILDVRSLSARHIGQYHLIRGYVKSAQRWRFNIGKLSVSVPRKHRQWFTPADLPETGKKVIVRGRIRMSVSGQLYLALHSPFDME